MYYSKKVSNNVASFFTGDDILANCVIGFEYAVEHPFDGAMRFIASLPMLFAAYSVFDYYDGQHLQYAFGIGLFILEVLHKVTKNAEVYNWPVIAFNTMVFHPLASYAYAVTIPMDAVRFIYNKLTKKVTLTEVTVVNPENKNNSLRVH